MAALSSFIIELAFESQRQALTAAEQGAAPDRFRSFVTLAAGELGRSVAARGLVGSSRINSMKKQIIIASSFVLALIAIFFIGRSLLHNSPGHLFFRQYKQLRPGMTLRQVQGIFGRAPDYVCGFNGGKIVYYSRGHITDKKPNPRLLPASVRAANQIPYVYGSGQFLFNSKGVLTAYTVCGEEVNIHTSKGNFQGSELSRLSNTALKQLAA